MSYEKGWFGNTPWHDVYKDTIVELALEEGVTKYGDNLFFGLVSVTSLKIPETLVEIGGDAFSLMESLTFFMTK